MDEIFSFASQVPFFLLLSIILLEDLKRLVVYPFEHTRHVVSLLSAF
jgi:hypothetical protein